MKYGVFTSETLEIALTKNWALCLYYDIERSAIGSKLYRGDEERKTLIAVCERTLPEKKTVYAFEGIDGKLHTNDEEGIGKLLGLPFTYSLTDLQEIDEIEITEGYEMPAAYESNIAECLKKWRMGTEFNLSEEGMNFSMVTNKIEYVFMMLEQDCNIYCGASVYIPYEEGMFGSGQYFRFRNFADNSAPYCGFGCRLGKPISKREVQKVTCESGTCTITEQGLYWPLKRYTEEEIVLGGCGGEEYIYYRNGNKDEYFRCV